MTLRMILRYSRLLCVTKVNLWVFLEFLTALPREQANLLNWEHIVYNAIDYKSISFGRMKADENAPVLGYRGTIISNIARNYGPVLSADEGARTVFVACCTSGEEPYNQLTDPQLLDLYLLQSHHFHNVLFIFATVTNIPYNPHS